MQGVYATITVQECQRLHASMPTQIAAILEAKRRWKIFSSL
jgi:hypothetical protein